ncbi:hypothetical protein L1O03_00165 [Corynebacterium uropygiale]|uniref:Uncharacterized protein n=1 Tax=Corynebacterium uropygiale TaxID=1775911 RepID=A0A9X1TY98_9CORY|nr:hypothetical protein [Corynebacterium uropygiale]MCF4005601.1 hypothetical protein [Corynebacterium uropygiale]
MSEAAPTVKIALITSFEEPYWVSMDMEYERREKGARNNEKVALGETVERM